MITVKLAIAILAFILSSGQIVFQTFQHHHAINPKHGAIKFVVFLLSSLSLLYLAKDIYSDFDTEKQQPATITATASPAELDYWHGIDREASPEGYCDYLEKYPQGQFEQVAKYRAGDCLDVKRAAEAQKKSQSEVQALEQKFDNEAKTLAEKNAALEQEAKENAARIVALEQAKAEAEQLKIDVKSNPKPEFSPQTEQTSPKIDSEITPQLENEDPLF